MQNSLNDLACVNVECVYAHVDECVYMHTLWTNVYLYVRMLCDCMQIVGEYVYMHILWVSV